MEGPMTRRFTIVSKHLLRGALAAAAVATLSQPVAAAAAGPPLNAAAFIGLVEAADARSAARDWPAAIPLWEKVVAANPVEGRFWSRLATARYGAKDYRGAIPAYEKAFALGYGAPQNIAYNIACSYALLGEKDAAFAWLARALAGGFLNLENLRTDSDLASLRGDPRFAKLVPIPADLSTLSREEGWRSDLRFLLWQIDRIGASPWRLHPRGWFEQRFAEIAASVPRRTDTQLSLDLLVVLRDLGDGHSGVVRGATEDWALTLPLKFEAFEEGIFITAADPANRQLVGAQLLEIGGRPVETVVAQIADKVARDNDGPWLRLQASYRLRNIALLAAAGLVPERGGAALRLRMPDGGEQIVRVAADMSQPDIWNAKPGPAGWVTLGQTRPGPDPLYLRDPGKNYWFEYLPDARTVYFAFNSVVNAKEETIGAFCQRLEKFIADNKVDRLVIDLRWNNGGNTFLLGPVLRAVIRSDRINRKGRLFVLIGGRTFSAAQNGATLLERFTEATFVGEPTGSSPNFVGEDDPFTLPYSKVTVNVSDLAWQSGYPQDRRTWIAPTLYIPPTFAAYRDKRDPALEAILSLPIPPG
jgi:tetratricopeptide (TPR) repeat protein